MPQLDKFTYFLILFTLSSCTCIFILKYRSFASILHGLQRAILFLSLFLFFLLRSGVTLYNNINSLLRVLRFRLFTSTPYEVPMYGVFPSFWWKTLCLARSIWRSRPRTGSNSHCSYDGRAEKDNPQLPRSVFEFRAGHSEGHAFY